MGASTAAALERLGVPWTERELDERVAAAIEATIPRAAPVNPADEFTEHEIAALQEGGFDLAPPRARDDEPIMRTATAYAALVASSLSVAAAAGRVKVDGSRIRQRLARRQAYGIRQAGKWLLPLFQFTDDAFVPGVERVLRHLDERLHPLAVQGWFLRPHPDLYDPEDEHATPISPRDWLLRGGTPVAVAELIEDAAGYQ